MLFCQPTCRPPPAQRLANLRQHLGQVIQRADGLLLRAAFHRQYSLERSLLKPPNNPAPVDNPVATGAAHRRARHLVAFGLGLLRGPRLSQPQVIPVL